MAFDLAAETPHFMGWPLSPLSQPADVQREAIERVERKVDVLSSQIVELRHALSEQREHDGELPKASLPVLAPTALAQLASITSLGETAPRLVEPIPILVETLGDKVVVSDEQVNMYGTGPTLNQALLDYRDSLLEYFEWLTAHEQTLAAHLKEHLAWLRQRLQPAE
jgi:hypothetical protein